ncbi:MAG: hypothetical protein Q4C70_12000 [Planctomycetia bacterium]|nr:hypothetical protein [Planctomycetia bacterium]
MRKCVFWLLALMIGGATVNLAISPAVAQYQPTSEKGIAQLEADYLFQCDNQPTYEKARQEIVYAQQVAERITKMPNVSDLSAQLAALAEVEKKFSAIPETAESAKDFYLAVRRAKREIVMRNPILDFNEIVVIDNPYPKGKPGDAADEWGHEARHRNGFMAEDGGKLLVVGLNPGEIKKTLLDNGGSFWRPDVSFDAKKILFSHRLPGEKSFHLFEMNADGSGLKQLTVGDYDDLDPIYTPQGKIVFCTSRQHSYVRCMPMTHAFSVARCDADGKNIYVISANGEPEYLPSMMTDGRVIFTRWEYTDKALWRVQSLWTINPDGTNPQTFWGNQSVWPDVLTEARQIPGSKKVVFTGVGHHAWFDGAIGYINPEEGLNYPDGLEHITQEVPFVEVGNGPDDIRSSYDYHKAGDYYAYKSPYPLSEEYMLVSARDALGRGPNKRSGSWLGDGVLYNGPHNEWYFNLYFQDVYGNKELIYEGDYNAYYASPLRAREVPVEKPDLVQWPKIGSGEKPADGILYSNNVFEGADPILKEKGKYIRVIQMDPKTYTTWNKTVQHDGPAVSVFQADGVKRILGTVPIEPDGSVNFKIPPGQALFFEMLDENGMAIHVMRSFTYVMPGENRGCFGCHESNMSTRSNKLMGGGQMGSALRKPAVDLTPTPWGTESISYMRFVQPVLDKNCGKCHQNPESDAFKKLNMTCRPSSKGWWANVHSRPGDQSPFCEPYLTLVSGDCGWGGNKPKNEKGVPINLAGVFVVEGYDQRDPKNLETLPPYTAWSPTSTIIKNATSGEHHGVKVSKEDAERLIAWVDCNGPYLGDEEVRSMFDPSSVALVTVPPIRPRIRSAPVINRFDIRQDGDSEKVSGTLTLAPEAVESDQNLVQLRKAADERMKAAALAAKYRNKPLDGKIISAVYGVDVKSGKNVTEILTKYVDGKMVSDIPKYNDIFTDVIYGQVKSLFVTVRFNDGKEKSFIFTENSPVVLIP